VRTVCDSCGARFRIADDLVRGRTVKVRCRRCGAAVEVSLPAGRGRRSPPPPPAGPEEWYLAVGAGCIGPLSMEELHLRVQRGEVGAEDLIWREGLSGWETIARVPAVRVALGLPRLPRRTNPPLLPVLDSPPLAAGAPRLAVINGQAAVAAQIQPAPAQPAPRPTPAPAPRPLARWPVVLLILGSLALALAAVVVLLGREPAPDGTTAAPRRPVHQPRRPVYLPPEQEIDEEPYEGPVVEEPPPPFEVFARRQPQRSGPTDAGAVAADAGADAGKHLDVTMAARILRRNRGSLSACDQLAERRGERLEGNRARFAVRVDAAGQVTVAVSGEGLSAQLLACYRSMVSQWEIPRIGRPYATQFSHVHRPADHPR